eukprot:Rmarinus@m.23984
MRWQKKHHPDRGGDEEKFKEYQFAFDILGDPKRREIYDKYGEEAAKDGQEPGGGMEDLLGAMFGGGMGRGRGPRKAKDIGHKLAVPLEDLYVGKTKKLAIQRRRVCMDCSGRGGKGDIQARCKECDGKGVKIVIHQLGPGMIQQMQAACPACQGKGRVIPDKDKCTHCDGEGVTQERKVLDVYIEPGMKDGAHVRLEGEGDESPDVQAGDVVIIIDQKEHDVFKRRGNDLLVEKTITLQEALCGFTMHLKTLDGRKISVSTPPGECVQPDEFRIVPNEGMPMNGKRDLRGKLIVYLKIKFPSTLSDEERQTVLKLWPLPKQADAPGPEDHIDHEYQMVVASERDLRDSPDDDDDDMGMPGGSRVQCAQQ